MITARNDHTGAVGGNGITSLAPVTRESVGLSEFVCVRMRFCACVRVKRGLLTPSSHSGVFIFQPLSGLLSPCRQSILIAVATMESN